MPWSGRQSEFLERTPEKKASDEPSTKHGIEPVHLCASLFQAHLSIDTVPSFLLQREYPSFGCDRRRAIVLLLGH